MRNICEVLTKCNRGSCNFIVITAKQVFEHGMRCFSRQVMEDCHCYLASVPLGIQARGNCSGIEFVGSIFVYYSYSS